MKGKLKVADTNPEFNCNFILEMIYVSNFVCFFKSTHYSTYHCQNVCEKKITSDDSYTECRRHTENTSTLVLLNLQMLHF